MLKLKKDKCVLFVHGVIMIAFHKDRLPQQIHTKIKKKINVY